MAIINAHFDRQKEAVLSKSDLSRKGSVDEGIVDLVEWINHDIDLVTTSSCSGRQLLFVSGERRKRDCRWLHSSHSRLVDVDVDDDYHSLVEGSISQLGQDDRLMFKFEPFILHLQCRSLAMAQRIHCIALNSGFRNSGITIGRSGRTTVAIRSTLNMEVPLSRGPMLLISREYLTFLCDEASKKFVENEILIARFFANLKEMSREETSNK